MPDMHVRVGWLGFMAYQPLSAIEFQMIYIHTHTYIYISSSSSCYATSTDIPDPLSPLSLSFVASGRFSGLYPVSSHSCCMYILAGRHAYGRPYVGVHWSTSLMSSSLLLQQCSACLIRLAWIVFVMVGRWPYSWCFVGVAARTYSVLLSTFVFNCRLASSPAVSLASKWCIHTAVSTRPLSGRNCVSFYRSRLISKWSIAYQ